MRKTGEYVIDRENSERFNVLKFLFMVMVVFLHSQELPVFSHEFYVPAWVQTVKDVIDKDLFLVAVPGFFVMSSVLLYSKQFTWKDNMKKKVRSVLVPYAVINTFWLVFFKVMSMIPAVAPYFSSDQYSVRTMSDVLNAYFGGFPLYYPFWFLKDLFFLNLAASVLKYLVEKLPLLSGILFIVWYYSGYDIPILKSNDSLFYWVIGIYIVEFGFYFRCLEKISSWEWLSAVIVSSAVVYFNKNTVTLSVYITVAFGYCYILAGKLLRTRLRNRLLEWSFYSFFIFSFHEFYEAMLKKIIMSFLPQPGLVQLLEFILLPILITVLCVIFGRIFERLFPRVFRMIMGGRVIKND
ncbi:MAG: acyltransferase [Lachnospiraceae bacterium]|nr:acyltransferase [Lachnospiraceae bacterium]